MFPFLPVYEIRFHINPCMGSSVFVGMLVKWRECMYEMLCAPVLMEISLFKFLKAAIDLFAG